MANLAKINTIYTGTGVPSDTNPTLPEGVSLHIDDVYLQTDGSNSLYKYLTTSSGNTWVKQGDLKGDKGINGKSFRYANVNIDSDSDVNLANITNLDGIAIGDIIADNQGDIYSITAVTATNVHVSDVIAAGMMKGPKGDKGDPATLPVASATILGGVKVAVGSAIGINNDGTIDVKLAGNGGLFRNSNGTLTTHRATDTQFGVVLAKPATDEDTQEVHINSSGSLVTKPIITDYTQLTNKPDLTTYQTKTDDSLSTTDKTIVGAINELNGKTPDLTSYQTKEDDTLSTTDKTVTGAINEIKGNVDTNKTNIGTLSKLVTNDKGSLVGAINEVHSDIPDMGLFQQKTDNTLSTTSKTVVGAINELFATTSNTFTITISVPTDSNSNYQNLPFTLPEGMTLDDFGKKYKYLQVTLSATISDGDNQNAGTATQGILMTLQGIYTTTVTSSGTTSSNTQLVYGATQTIVNDPTINNEIAVTSVMITTSSAVASGSNVGKFATISDYGIVKPGKGLTISQNGILDVDTSTLPFPTILDLTTSG